MMIKMMIKRTTRMMIRMMFKITIKMTIRMMIRMMVRMTINRTIMMMIRMMITSDHGGDSLWRLSRRHIRMNGGQTSRI